METKLKADLQILMRQFEITKNLPKCTRNQSPLCVYWNDPIKPKPLITEQQFAIVIKS